MDSEPNKQMTRNVGENSNATLTNTQSRGTQRKTSETSRNQQQRIKQMQQKYQSDQLDTNKNQYKAIKKPFGIPEAKQATSTLENEERSQVEGQLSNLNTIELKRSAVCPDKKASKIFTLSSNQSGPIPYKNISSLLIEDIPVEEQFKGCLKLLGLLKSETYTKEILVKMLKILRAIDRNIDMEAIQTTVKGFRKPMINRSDRWAMDTFLKKLSTNITPVSYQKALRCKTYSKSYLKKEIEKERLKYLDSRINASAIDGKIYPALQQLSCINPLSMKMKNSNSPTTGFQPKGPYAFTKWIAFDPMQKNTVKHAKPWHGTTKSDMGSERDSWCKQDPCEFKNKVCQRRRQKQEEREVLVTKRTSIAKNNPTKSEGDIEILIGFGSKRPLVRCPQMSSDKRDALKALHGPDVDVGVVLQRDRLLYGEFHPMNEAVAPLQILETPLQRHQISLPARKIMMMSNKTKGWNNNTLMTNFEVQKIIPNLKLYRNPTSCDDHQFIKQACDIVIGDYYERVKCLQVKRGWRNWYTLKTEQFLSPMQLHYFKKTYNAYTPCLLADTTMPTRITEVVTKPKRKKVYSPMDLIDGKSTKNSYKQTKECYLTRMSTTIAKSNHNIEADRKWNRHF